MGGKLEKLIKQLLGLGFIYFGLTGINIYLFYKTCQAVPKIIKALKEFDKARKNLMEVVKEKEYE